MKHWMERIVNRYASVLLAYPWLVLIMVAIVAGGSILGKSRLGFTTDHEVFFGEQNVQLKAFKALQKTYARDDTLLFVVKPKSGDDVFNARTLAVLADLTAKAWKLPYAARVDSITNFQHLEAYGDDLTVHDLGRIGPLDDPATLTKIREVALNEPSVVDLLVARDGKTVGVLVSMILPDRSRDPMAVAKAVNAAEALANEVKATAPELTVALTGSTVLASAYPKAAKQDIGFLIPVMYVVIIISLAVMLRSFWATLAIVILVGLTIQMTFGLGGWLGVRLTPPSAIFPTILMVVTIAEGVHLFVGTFTNMSQGMNKRDAITASLSENAFGVALTSFTDILGFASLNFADSPPFRDLGNLTSIGIVIGWLLYMVMLPCLAAVMPIRPARGNLLAPVPLVKKMTNLMIAQPTRTLYVVSLAAVVLSAGIFINRIDDYMIEYFDRTFKERVDTEFAMNNLAGIYTLEFSVESGAPMGILDPKYLERLDKFAQWLRQQPEVTHVASVSDTIKRINRAMNGDDPREYRLPTETDKAAQFMFLYEMSLPYGKDLNSQISVSKSASRVVATLGQISTMQMQDVKRRSEEWLRTHTTANANTQGTGLTMMFAYLTHNNIDNMVYGTGAAILTIVVATLIGLGGGRLGLMGVLPTTIAPLVAFGVWGYWAGEIGSGAAIVTAIAIGLTVDGTYHILSQYKEHRVDGGTPEEAIRMSLGNAGLAHFISSLVLVLGFFALSFSHFKMNAEIGQLSGLIILVSFVMDFILVPLLLLHFDRSWFGPKQYCQIESPAPSAIEA